MTALGQLLLVVAFVGSGYAAFACVAGWAGEHRALRRSGMMAAVTSVLALTTVSGILAWALVVRDFRFDYVAQYSSRLLPWHYSLSAFWVGQAGSLLLWAWLSAILALVYRFWPRRGTSELRPGAFGLLMAFLCFLLAIMLFAADPMRPTVTAVIDGAGLSPLLQHPAMLVHPPIVFLGYAGWTIPFALAVAALATGRLSQNWIGEARSWMLFAWFVLGGGILWGAYWAYEELGWGGYWAWDPVENASLIPWLTGTAMVHTAMVWRSRGGLKKTTVTLAILTFALCNFATFLTRSGIFSSLHAFSQSSVGWMFLLMMVAVTFGGGVLIVLRRSSLVADSRMTSFWSREVMVGLASLALLLLAAVTLIGTMAVPLSNLFFGRSIVVGQAYYNNVLTPVGLILLATMAMSPLLRWGKPPTADHRRTLLCSAGTGGLWAAVAAFLSANHPLSSAVTGFGVMALVALLGSLVLEGRRRESKALWHGLLRTLRERRRQYAGFLIHMGFVFLAIGVAGTSLGGRSREIGMDEGDVVQWAGHQVRYAGLIQRELPDRVVVEAQLEIAPDGGSPYLLKPAQHWHKLQDQWTTEVAIHSDWAGDFYTVARGGEAAGRADLTLVYNPRVRWLWASGWVVALGFFAGIWPSKRPDSASSEISPPRRMTRGKRPTVTAGTFQTPAPYA